MSQTLINSHDKFFSLDKMKTVSKELTTIVDTPGVRLLETVKEESFAYGQEEGRKEGIKEGIKEGRIEALSKVRKERKTTALELLSMNVSDDVILIATKLTTAELEELKQQYRNQ